VRGFTPAAAIFVVAVVAFVVAFVGFVAGFVAVAGRPVEGEAGAGFVVGRFPARTSPVVLIIIPPPSSTSTKQNPSRPPCQACWRRG
jgi:hypothetical protein